MKHYSRVFKPTEVQMMLGAFSNTETIHIAAYSHLLDTIGMAEVEYSAFLEYEAMKNKFDYMRLWGVDTNEDIAKTLFKLINKKGVINVGGSIQSVYKFAKKYSPKIKKISAKKFLGKDYPLNPSMNINKYKKIIK